MQNLATIFSGVTCLLIGMLAIYKLAPREGRPDVAFMQRDGVAVAVTLGLLMLMSSGVALLIKALAP